MCIEVDDNKEVSTTLSSNRDLSIATVNLTVIVDEYESIDACCRYALPLGLGMCIGTLSQRLHIPLGLDPRSLISHLSLSIPN